MADQLWAATQLPLFGWGEVLSHFPTHFEPPANTEPKQVDLQTADLRLATPYQNHERQIRRDEEREEAIRLMAILAGTGQDDIWFVYALFSNGDARFEVFEQFRSKFRDAQQWGLGRQWLEKIRRDAAKVGQAKRQTFASRNRYANGY